MGQGSTTLAGAGAAPQDNPPRQQPVKDSSTNESGAGARETCRKSETVASIQQKRERLRRSLFLLCPVSGVMNAELKHRNYERVTPVNPLGVLGKAVCLVQSVTIPSPIEIIVLCRVFALAFGLLEFLRNQTTDDFLTLCQRFHPLSTTDRPRLRTSAATAWAWWMLPRLLRSGYAALRNCGGKVAGRANGWDTTPEKGLSGLFSVGLRPRITVIQLYANISKNKVYLRITPVIRIKKAGGKEQAPGKGYEWRTKVVLLGCLPAPASAAAAAYAPACCYQRNTQPGAY